MDSNPLPMLRLLTLPAYWLTLLETLRPVFRRSSTFGLFVLLATGLVARTARRTVVGMLAEPGWLRWWHRQVVWECLWRGRCEWTEWRTMVADCVFQAAAAVMIWFQTAKRLVISVRHSGALIR